MADFNGRTAQELITSFTDTTLTELQFRANITDSINRVGDNCDRLDREKTVTLTGDVTGMGTTGTNGFTEGTAGAISVTNDIS